MTKNTKNKYLSIRLSEEEYEILKQKAKNNHLGLATYSREKLLFDVPRLEKHSFEYKVLKSISYIVGAVSVISIDQKEEVKAAVVKMMEKNGIEVGGE